MTYEDGMISCSALQLGELALRTNDYKPGDIILMRNAMLKLLDGHDRCLTQLRYLMLDAAEARCVFGVQYDVFMLLT